MRRLLPMLLLLGCEPDGAPEAAPWIGPLDDVLRLDHIQAEGTHNSYHVETTPVPAWAYTHAPLDVQLGEQGVRQFELDVWWDEAIGAHRVFHVPELDEGTTCDRLTDCLFVLSTWSARHRWHHPFVVLVETKDAWEEDTGPSRLDALDRALRSVVPPELLLTPAEVRGDHPDLATAIGEDGWPVLGEVRGRALYVLHDGGDRLATYREDPERPLWPDGRGDLDAPWAVFHSINDPWDERIADAVSRGYLVRTRSDVDGEPTRTGDFSQRDQALDSGAHFVSTDFPVPSPDHDYVLDIPGGTPSRCNPMSAPERCEAEALEPLLP